MEDSVARPWSMSTENPLPPAQAVVTEVRKVWVPCPTQNPEFGPWRTWRGVVTGRRACPVIIIAIVVPVVTSICIVWWVKGPTIVTIMPVVYQGLPLARSWADRHIPRHYSEDCTQCHILLRRRTILTIRSQLAVIVLMVFSIIMIRLSLFQSIQQQQLRRQKNWSHHAHSSYIVIFVLSSITCLLYLYSNNNKDFIRYLHYMWWFGSHIFNHSTCS